MTVDGITVRKAVHSYVSENPQATYDAVVAAVRDEVGAAQDTIQTEIDKMERNGFLYLVKSGDTTEVKVA